MYYHKQFVIIIAKSDSGYIQIIQNTITYTFISHLIWDLPRVASKDFFIIIYLAKEYLLIYMQRGVYMKKPQSDVAYEYIKKQITAKFYFPGCRLVEEDLVRDIGVSRTSVRAALSRLRYEGIVEGTPNRGMMIKRFRREDIVNAFQIRQTLEAGAFELAVRHITPAAIARMKQINRQMEQLMENFSISDFVKYNRDFHWEIALAAHNEYYEKYLDEILSTLNVCILFYNNVTDDRRSVMLHWEIIRALETKDVALGKQAIIADNQIAIADFSFPPLNQI